MRLTDKGAQERHVVLIHVCNEADDGQKTVEAELFHPIGVQSKDLPETLHFLVVQAQLLNHLHLHAQVLLVTDVVTSSHQDQEFLELQTASAVLVNVLQDDLNLRPPFFGLCGLRKVLGDDFGQLRVLDSSTLVLIEAVEAIAQSMYLCSTVAGVLPNLVVVKPSIMFAKQLEGGSRHGILRVQQREPGESCSLLSSFRHSCFRVIVQLRNSIRQPRNRHMAVASAVQHSEDAPLLLPLFQNKLPHELEKPFEIKFAGAVHVELLNHCLNLGHSLHNAKPSHHSTRLQPIESLVDGCILNVDLWRSLR
mmetsp:Transcript_64924/g.152714  ORF Transcript_64924/g.152714 Transcript_64924/m.152714 type:complete len:308 (+) Transcript_64924:306-1229(+)